MEIYIKAGRLFYAAGMIGLAVQQFIYSDFRPVFLSPSPVWMHNPVWAFIFAAVVAICALLIAIDRNGYAASVTLGSLFFLFFVLQAVYVLFIGSNSAKHLGLWTDPLKELALSGGAFVIAASYLPVKTDVFNKPNMTDDARRLLFIGKLFFSIMLIAFGLDHFYYTDFVATLVPSWIPGHVFWTYVAGTALMGAGIISMFSIKLRLFSSLTALMLFIWLIILHIPRAVADPYGTNGNETTSCFEALAFSGIALVIAFATEKKGIVTKTVLA